MIDVLKMILLHITVNALTLSGQFKNKNVHIEGDITSKHSHATLTFLPGGRQTTVKAGTRKNRMTMESASCWLANDQGEGVVDGTDKDYIVNDLLFDKLAPQLENYI